jgi:hypothetical protein
MFFLLHEAIEKRPYRSSSLARIHIHKFVSFALTEETTPTNQLRKEKKGEGSEAVAPQYTFYTGITRKGCMLSAATCSATCAFFASAACRISAGSLSRPRTTWWRWRVWSGAKVVEPRCRTRVSTCRVSVLSVAATCRLRRWRELRPVERQRWRKEGELRIGTYPAPARGSKHVREQVICVLRKMRQCNPRCVSRRPVGW